MFIAHSQLIAAICPKGLTVSAFNNEVIQQKKDQESIEYIKQSNCFYFELLSCYSQIGFRCIGLLHDYENY